MKNSKTAMTIPDLTFVAGFFSGDWVAIEECIDKIIHTHGINPNLLHKCLEFLIFDQVHSDFRRNFSTLSEDLSSLSKIRRDLTSISKRLCYEYEIPNEFWKWHEKTTNMIKTDIHLAQKFMVSKKPSKGARKKLIRDTALKTIISYGKKSNTTKRIEDVAELAILTDALADDKAAAIESLHKIYYNKKIKPMVWK